jgi:hypothetical protein
MEALMTRPAEDVRRQLVGFACRHPEELRTAGARNRVPVQGTTLFVPVVASKDMPLVGRHIGFSAGDRSNVLLGQIETTEVLGSLAKHGVGVRAAVTWTGDGFFGHLETWASTGDAQGALTRLRELFDATWPEVGGDGVVLEGPPPGSDKHIAQLTWSSGGLGSGQLGVTCHGASFVTDATTAGLEDSREVLLELFEGVELVVDGDGSLRRTKHLATARVQVDLADAADWRVHRA